MSSEAIPPRRSARFHFIGILIVLIICRMILLGFAPHDDPSESRYAEIARKMVETGNWITPQFDYGVPFWAKPPLSMWMSAVGMILFGVNEFGSRIFIFLTALGVLGLVAKMADRERDRDTAWAAAALLMGMPMFFYCSAAVMTDLLLVAGTTFAMASFRFAILTNSRRWGYAFFVALAIGLLAKGPLVLVLAGAPLGLWTLLTGKWKTVWQRLPWISGTVLMLAIAMPWYVLAERRTPGFIDYFIVGEHWKRFTEKGWRGDLYGSGRAWRTGTIWIFWLIATFPWCLGFFALPLRQWRKLRAWAMAGEARGLYLLLWMLCPLVFFTPARNIISTYPLPALPATALLLADIATARIRERGLWRIFHPLHPSLVAISACVITVAFTIAFIRPKISPEHSERALVRRYLQERGPDDTLAMLRERKFSAEFYTAGKAITVKPANLADQLDQPGRLFLAATGRDFAKLPEPLHRRFMPVEIWDYETLYVERLPTSEPSGVDPPTNR